MHPASPYRCVLGLCRGKTASTTPWHGGVADSSRYGFVIVAIYQPTVFSTVGLILFEMVAGTNPAWLPLLALGRPSSKRLRIRLRLLLLLIVGKQRFVGR